LDYWINKRKTLLAKIMIVDDDQTTVSLLSTLLELDGFDVVAVRQGSEVIGRAEAEQPELIMVDFHLTDMEGVDVIKAIRAHSTLSAVPIVMASGLDVSDAALAAGANKFLIKPFEPSDLPELFNTLIAG
jgi:two-component system response regulator MtrA